MYIEKIFLMLPALKWDVLQTMFSSGAVHSAYMSTY